MQAMSLEDGPAEATAGVPEPPPKAKRKHPRWLILLEVLTVLAVVAPFIAYEVATNLGGSTNPGASLITVTNDGPATLTLQSCAPGCPSPAEVVLTSGSSSQLSVAKKGTTYYLVGGGGASAGCLVLTPGERSPVPTSRAGACSGQAPH